MVEGLLLLPMAELVPHTGIPDYKNKALFRISVPLGANVPNYKPGANLDFTV